jgi:serine/threonine-protein kinase RsbW
MPTLPSPTEFTALIRCPPGTVDDAHDFIEGVWAQRPDVSAAQRMVVETAASELLTNVVQYNPDLSVLCELTVAIAPDVVVLEIADSGAEVAATQAGRMMPADEDEGGRGLALVRMICDDLSYRRVGSRNLWRVETLRSFPDGQPDTA